MKRKLSILLIGSIIAVSFAGCGNNSPSESKNPESNTSNTSSLSSSASSDNSSSAEQNDENGENSSNVSAQVQQSENNENQTSQDGFISTNGTQYIDTSAIVVSISNENMAKSTSNLDEPSVYLITSADELSKFYEQYKEDYSLDTVDSGDTFSDTISAFDDEYFKLGALVITVFKYDKTQDSELGEISREGNDLSVLIYAEKPEKAENTAWQLIIGSVSKSDVENSTPKASIVSILSAFTDEDPNGDAEVIVTDGEEASDSSNNEEEILIDEEVIDEESSNEAIDGNTAGEESSASEVSE